MSAGLAVGATLITLPRFELEALLLTQPAIADAAVIGVPNEEAGELPVDCAVLKPERRTSAEKILPFTATQVAHSKKLYNVHFIDVIPKSASGKVLRRLRRKLRPWDSRSQCGHRPPTTSPSMLLR